MQPAQGRRPRRQCRRGCRRVWAQERIGQGPDLAQVFEHHPQVLVVDGEQLGDEPRRTLEGLEGCDLVAKPVDGRPGVRRGPVIGDGASWALHDDGPTIGEAEPGDDGASPASAIALEGHRLREEAPDVVGQCSRGTHASFLTASVARRRWPIGSERCHTPALPSDRAGGDRFGGRRRTSAALRGRAQLPGPRRVRHRIGRRHPLGAGLSVRQPAQLHGSRSRGFDALDIRTHLRPAP